MSNSPLETPELLWNILWYVPKKTLQNCKRVNLLFEDTAIGIISAKNKIKKENKVKKVVESKRVLEGVNNSLVIHLSRAPKRKRRNHLVPKKSIIKFLQIVDQEDKFIIDTKTNDLRGHCPSPKKAYSKCHGNGCFTIGGLLKQLEKTDPLYADIEAFQVAVINDITNKIKADFPDRSFEEACRLYYKKKKEEKQLKKKRVWNRIQNRAKREEIRRKKMMERRRKNPWLIY